MTPVLENMREEAAGNRRPPMITEGPTLCRINAITEKRGAESGEPFLEMIFEPVDKEWEPALIYHNFTLQLGMTPQGSPMRWALFNFLVSMGHDPEEVDSFNTDVLLNRHVIVHVVHEAWGGDIRNKAKKVEGTDETTKLDVDAGLVAFEEAPVTELVPA